MTAELAKKLVSDGIDMQGHSLPVVDLEYEEEISFGLAVLKATEAKRFKKAVINGVEVGFGRYIAELSTVESVEHGGIAKFAKAIGMNYATLKKHRSRYLEAGQKRKYERKWQVVTLLLDPDGNGAEELAPVKDEIVLTGEDALLWRKLKPRMAALRHENRLLKKRARNCPHCSGLTDAQT